MNIICDLDGTIALDHKRNHFLHKEQCPRHHLIPGYSPVQDCICTSDQRDWKSYFDACDTDEPCHAVIQILASMDTAGHTIYILSGRSLSANDKTLKWLEKYKVSYHYLQMRSQDDRTDDHKLKLIWCELFNLRPKNTLFVLEDRTRVVDAWRAAGFRCFQVAPGNF